MIRDKRGYKRENCIKGKYKGKNGIKGRLVSMINRVLTEREKEICEMIRDDTDNMTFRGIVDIVRRDLDTTMSKDRKWFKQLNNQ